MISWTSAGLSGVHAERSPIKLGAIVSLTGPAAEQGKNWLNGAQLAKEELLSQGLTLELVVEDDTTQSSKVVTTFQKLVNLDRVDAILGGTWDYLAETAYPLAAQYRKPFLTPTNPPELISAAARSNSFVFTNALTLSAEKLAIEALLKDEGVTSIALIYPDIPWGQSHATIMKGLARELGLKIVYENQFPLEAYLDIFKISALKVSHAKPDLLYVTFDYNGLDLITSELEKLKSNPVLLDTQHLDVAMDFSKRAAKYKNAFGIYPEAIENREFEARYKAKYGSGPRVYAAEGYDALMFLARALQAGVNLGDPESSFQYMGVSGVHRLPTKNRGLVENKAIVMSGRTGKFAKVLTRN